MDTYPVNLLLKNRRCLVVGGGKVASRKLDRLINTGADISVVSRKASSKIKDLSQSGKLELHERNFKESDLDGVFLVYLATDDRKLNLKILDIAEKREILSCSVDRNWSSGSFITPASVSHKEITVAVSSQGTDCRKSRLIKENLARHIDSIENTGLLLIGTDHNLMTLEQLEQIQLNGSKLKKAGDMIQNLWGIQEFMLFNTCNRIEVIAVASPSEPLIEILKMILKLDHVNEEQFYIKTGYEAFRHLCLTSAGMLSQTSGENHICSQFKQACVQAKENNWAGVLLESLKDSVLHVSRKIRNETKSAFKGFEVEELVLEILKEKFADVSGKKIIIAGTGLVGSSIKNILADEGCEIDWLYFSKKPEKKHKKVSVNKLSSLTEKLTKADIVICALSSESPVITTDMAHYFKPEAEVIDIGMPRNVSPHLAETRKDVNFSSMEDIKHWYRKRHSTKGSIFLSAEGIIEKHKEEYEKFSNSFIGRRQKQ